MAGNNTAINTGVTGHVTDPKILQASQRKQLSFSTECGAENVI
jgi:hypothetical protein